MRNNFRVPPRRVLKPRAHVGGTSAPSPELRATAAGSYLSQVDADVLSLAADVVVQTGPGAPPNMIGQGFIGPWVDFLNRDPPSPEEEQPAGWRVFRRDNSSLAVRLVSADAIMLRTGEFERRLIELRAKFVELGGVPSLDAPVPGYEGPLEEDDDTDWGFGLGLGLGAATPIVIGGGLILLFLAAKPYLK